MSDKKAVGKKLAKLSDNIRLTVEIIHKRYAEGKPLRYRDVRMARQEAGLPVGSETTIRKGFNAWRDIYGVEEHTYNTPMELELLVKKTITQIREEVGRHYRQEANVKIAAADEIADLTGNRLKDLKAELETQTARVGALEQENHELNESANHSSSALQTITQEHRLLENEYGKLTVTSASLEKELKTLSKTLTKREHALEQYREDMESQRHGYVKTIDEWKTEAKKTGKLAETARKQLEKSEQRQLETHLKCEQEVKKVKQLRSDVTEERKVSDKDKRTQSKQITQLEQDKQALANKVLQLEAMLNTEHQRNNEQQKSLLKQFETMIAKNQPRKKTTTKAKAKR